jgi:hypothetical protein
MEGIFDGLVTGLILIGVALGFVIVGFLGFLYWLFSHITIGWI